MTAFTDHEKKVAGDLLATLLPLAREEIAKDPPRLEYRTAVAKAQRQYLIEDNLLGVHIYHANTGGWIANIYFTNTPPWIPNVIGTPVGSPCKTRNDAIQQAIHMLGVVLANKPTELDKSPPVFTLHDIVFSLPENLLELISKKQSETDDGHIGYGSKDEAVKRLETILNLYFGAIKPSYDSLMELDRDSQIHILSICCMCSLSGIFRYPNPEPAVVTD